MQDATGQTVLIRCGILADGLGGRPLRDAAVLVQGDRIERVGAAAEIARDAPPGAEQVDLGDLCLIPGLVDAHTHTSLSGDGRTYAEQFRDSDELMALVGAMNLRKHLRAGITTIREHGARNMVGFAIRESVRRGYVPGPRMLVSGRPITCTKGHFHFCNEVADGEEEIRRSVRRLVHEGADYIKIMASGGGTEGTDPGLPSYSTGELRAAVHEAHNFHRLTAAHCRARESMRRAVDAGLDLIEHAEFLDPDGEMRFDEDLAKMMVEAKVWISPTLQAWTRYPRIVELRAAREAGAFGERQEEELAGLERRMETRLRIVRRMVDAGMGDRMVPGTDAGPNNIAFGHLDYDLQLFTMVGLTPSQALTAASAVSAEAVGLAGEIGTIEPGRIADLVAVCGDPNADVGAFSHVEAVFQAGRRVR